MTPGDRPQARQPAPLPGTPAPRHPAQTHLPGRTTPRRPPGTDAGTGKPAPRQGRATPARAATTPGSPATRSAGTGSALSRRRTARQARAQGPPRVARRAVTGWARLLPRPAPGRHRTSPQDLPGACRLRRRSTARPPALRAPCPRVPAVPRSAPGAPTQPLPPKKRPARSGSGPARGDSHRPEGRAGAAKRERPTSRRAPCRRIARPGNR